MIDRGKAHKPLDPIDKGKPLYIIELNQKGKEKVIFHPIDLTCKSKDFVATMDKSLIDKPIEKGKDTTIQDVAKSCSHVNEFVVNNQYLNSSGEDFNEKDYANQDDVVSSLHVNVLVVSNFLTMLLIVKMLVEVLLVIVRWLKRNASNLMSFLLLKRTIQIINDFKALEVVRVDIHILGEVSFGVLRRTNMQTLLRKRTFPLIMEMVMANQMKFYPLFCSDHKRKS